MKDKHPAESLRAMNAQPVAQQGWMPIESAPKDGRTLLLGHFNSHGKWRTCRGQWFSDEAIAQEWEDGEDCDADWYETSVEKDDPPNCWRTTPTHWMPLPAAPGALAAPPQAAALPAVTLLTDERIETLWAATVINGPDTQVGPALPLVFARAIEAEVNRGRTIPAGGGVAASGNTSPNTRNGDTK